MSKMCPEIPRSGSFSNCRHLSKALFQGADFSNTKNNGAQSGRLNLQDDLNSIKLTKTLSPPNCNPVTSRHLRTRRTSDKENMVLDMDILKGVDVQKEKISLGIVIPGWSKRRPTLAVKDINAFHSSPVENQLNEVEDEVFFDENVLPSPKETGNTFNSVLSTPTMCGSRPAPSSVCSGSSQCQFSFEEESANSPNISRSTCICTPVRQRLVEEGLGDEKTVLGTGAYGTVVLGRWLGKKVAVKVMEKDRLKRSNRRRKSLEGELHARKMNHNNILKVFDICSVENMNAILIMEYVGSRNLHRLLSTHETQLSVEWLLQCGYEVASALEHCHARGVVHMDVKPANILITSSGLCKLGDFGCSVSLDVSESEIDSTLVGTPGYQAPEFLRGSSPSPAYDIYSLGIMLWQLDSREIPFQGVHAQIVMFQVVSSGARPPSPPRHLSFVGREEFSSLHQQCWAQEPEARPTAAVVASRLKMMQDSKDSETRPTSSTVASRLKVIQDFKEVKQETRTKQRKQRIGTQGGKWNNTYKSIRI